MNIRNNRGLSLVEMLIATAIIAIVMPMIASILISSIQDYASGVNYVAQQDSINGIYQTLRSDYERSRSIKIEHKIENDTYSYKSITMEYNYEDNPIDPIKKEWYFNDVINTDGTDSDSDELKMIDHLNGGDHVVLSNVLVRPKGASPTSPPKSAIRVKSMGDFYKITIEIWFNDINTQFFKGRNYSSPVVISFDTTGKFVPPIVP